MANNPHRDTPEYLNGFRAAFAGSLQTDCPHERGSLAWKQWTSGWFNYHPSYGDQLVVRQRRDGWTVTRVASGQEYGAWKTAEDALHAFRENASLGLVSVER